MAEKLDPKETISLLELTVSHMWSIACLVEVLERKGVLTKQEVRRSLSNCPDQANPALEAIPEPYVMTEVEYYHPSHLGFAECQQPYGSASEGALVPPESASLMWANCSRKRPRINSYLRGLVDDPGVGYHACQLMPPSLKAEELAVLQFLHRQGGLCTMTEWKKFARRERTKHEVLQRLIHRGKILAPGLGQLYIISDTGYRSIKMYQKQSP